MTFSVWALEALIIGALGLTAVGLVWLLVLLVRDLRGKELW